MKKSPVKTLALLCLVLTIVSCNKETDHQAPNGVGEVSRNPLEQLRTFKKQMEHVKANPEVKTGETIALEEALWDVENFFNLTYSDAESYYSKINEHELVFSIPVDMQQQVTVHDAVNFYEQVVGQAREALASEAFDNKGFVSLTLKSISTDAKGTIVTFSGRTGGRCNYNLPSAHLEGPFGDEDDWMFAAPLGKCDDPDIPSGADEQMQEQLYANLILPFVRDDDDCRNIYVDRRRFVFDGTTYSGIYYNEDADLCINHEEMNDYYAAEKRVITQTIPTQYHFSGLSPISIEIKGIGLDNNALTHRNEIEYGVRMEVSKEEFGELGDLLLR